jgi:hypothetical protein
MPLEINEIGIKMRVGDADSDDEDASARGTGAADPLGPRLRHLQRRVIRRAGLQDRHDAAA